MNASQKSNEGRILAARAKHEAIDQFFYEVYEVCLKHPDIPAFKKQKVLEWAADLGADSWPITGITVAALRRFAEQRDFTGIQRGHTGEYGRRDRVKHLLQQRMSKDELLVFFREGDKTTLITIQEQRQDRSRLILVTEPGLFRGDGTVEVTNRNLAWADDRVRELDAEA